MILDNYNKYNVSKSDRLKMLVENGYKVPYFGSIYDSCGEFDKVVIYKNEFEHGPENLTLINLKNMDINWLVDNNKRFCTEFIDVIDRGLKFNMTREIYYGNKCVRASLSSFDWNGEGGYSVDGIEKFDVKDRPFPDLPCVSIEWVGDYAIDLHLLGDTAKWVYFGLDKQSKSGIISEVELIDELKRYKKERDNG